MKEPKSKIFNWNHISENLKQEEIDELKGYYASYHRKCWAYKQAMKHLKRTRFVGNSASVIFGTGGIVACCCYIWHQSGCHFHSFNIDTRMDET